MNLSFDLNDIEAWGLAQFLKRMRWDIISQLSQDETEAVQVSDALVILQEALYEKGISPR